MGQKQKDKIAALKVALNEVEQDKAITEAALAETRQVNDKYRQRENVRRFTEQSRKRLEERAKAAEARQETLDNLRKGLVSVDGADVSFHYGTDPGVTIELSLNAEESEALSEFVSRPRIADYAIGAAKIGTTADDHVRTIQSALRQSFVNHLAGVAG